MKVLIFLSVLAIGGALIQEISIHERDLDNIGNSHIFRQGIPDITLYPFPNRTLRMCHNSRMVLYTDFNYTGRADLSHAAYGCHGLTSAYKSLRFFGNLNTSIDAVSLFPQTELRGEEIYVERVAYAGIAQNMLSLAYTGTSDWTVFEGSNFEGSSACLTSGRDTDSVPVYNVTSLNVTSVRSLIKGCVTNVTPELRRQLQEAALIN